MVGSHDEVQSGAGSTRGDVGEGSPCGARVRRAAVPQPPAPELESATVALDRRDVSWYTARCPKQMRHGPCGGVQDEGRCEVPGVVCPFPDAAGPVPWVGRKVTGGVPKVPRVLVDLRPDLTRLDETRMTSDLLARVGAGRPDR